MLLINDLINNVHERYQSFKKGDFTARVTIDPSIDPSKGGADAVPTAKITDLISFDDDEQDAGAADNVAGASSITDDFASLTFEAPSTNSNGASSKANTNSSLPLDLFDSNQQSSSSSQQPSMIGAPLGQWGALQLPMNTTPTPSSRNGSTTPALQPQPSQYQSAAAAPPSQSPADPFADLSKW